MGLFFKKKKDTQHEQLIKEEQELKEKLQKQDEQLEAIQKAESLYNETGDIGSLIAFWEGIWSSAGLLFNGSKWTFRLPDLYVQTKQYDDALRILKKIKDPRYKSKKDSYVSKIKGLTKT
jgi:predicted negative regulator of RcsB-dependent stress response